MKYLPPVLNPHAEPSLELMNVSPSSVSLSDILHIYTNMKIQAFFFWTQMYRNTDLHCAFSLKSNHVPLRPR